VTENALSTSATGSPAAATARAERSRAIDSSRNAGIVAGWHALGLRCRWASGLLLRSPSLSPVTLDLARRDRRSRPAPRLRGCSAASSPFRSTIRTRTDGSCGSSSRRNRRRTNSAARFCCSPAGRVRLRPRCSTSRPTSGHHCFRATTSPLTTTAALALPRHSRVAAQRQPHGAPQ
jgi:hypothetical protein